jgi:glycosyltransferase involved in cell wall biosynthesis
MLNDLKIAFVQDALPYQGGAEKVLSAALEVFPDAPIYTMIYNRKAFQGSAIERHPIHASFIDRLPGAHRHHRITLPLMPLALELLDLSRFEVVISFSYAVAHAAPTLPGQLHISYIHTPLRYAWRDEPVLPIVPGVRRLPGWALKRFLDLFRRWDTAMLNRTDHFLTNSQWMAGCIWKAYQRKAEVLYPPVDTEHFAPITPRADYYISVGRLVGYKRQDVLVRAFTKLGYPLLIVGEGPELNRLRAMAGPNVHFMGWQPHERVAKLLGEAKACVHAGEEDFGIALAEAQSAGCPVIAYQGGAAPEIVSIGESGLLFEEQDEDHLCTAVTEFEAKGVVYRPEQIHASARRFSQQGFKQRLERIVHEKWEEKKASQVEYMHTPALSPPGRSAGPDSLLPQGEGLGMRVKSRSKQVTGRSHY